MSSFVNGDNDVMAKNCILRFPVYGRRSRICIGIPKSIDEVSEDEAVSDRNTMEEPLDLVTLSLLDFWLFRRLRAVLSNGHQYV